MEALLPSEIARLVWGYLQKECPGAGHVFLKSCTALAECRAAKQQGRRLLDTVNGHTLEDLLSDLSDTFNLVNETQKSLPVEAQEEIKNKFSLCDKVQIITKHLSKIEIPVVESAIVNEPEVTGEVEERCTSPEESTSVADILTTSPMRALMANLANKLKQNKTNVPFKKRKMTGSPSMNLEATSDDSAMAPADMDPEAIFLPIFKNTLFHEKIAESINKILQPKKSCDDVLHKDLDVAIQQVVSETEKDPTFEEIIQEMCQVTSQAALSDGGSEENSILPPLSPPSILDLNESGQEVSQRAELHTPEPTDETGAEATPTRGRRSRQKGTPSRVEGEVPLKARLRSATKIGPRDDESYHEILLEKQNEDAVRSIVEAIVDIDLPHSPAPAEEVLPATQVPTNPESINMEGETLEISLSLEEQQQVCLFNEPVPIATTSQPMEPPAPIFPPVKYHLNPPMPTHPVGSVILIMDQDEVYNKVPEETIILNKLVPIVPNGQLPASLALNRKKFCTDKSRGSKLVADRNLGVNSKKRKKPAKSASATGAEYLQPIITMDGVIVHPSAPFPIQIETLEPPALPQALPPPPPPPVFVTPSPVVPPVPPTPAVVPESPVVIPPSPSIIPPSPAFIPPTPSPVHPGMPVSQMAFVSMPSVSPAQPALPKTGLFAVKAKTPVAPVPAESSAERPIETRKSFSTPRRDSSYVRTLDFSTPPQNKVAARRALTSPKVIKPRGGFASAKHLSTAAKIVRSGLFDKSPEGKELRSKKSPKGRLSLIAEEDTQAPAVVKDKQDSSSKTQSWDAKLRSIVGPIEPSPVKRSPTKKRQRIGGVPKESPRKASKPAQAEPEKTKKPTKEVQTNQKQKSPKKTSKSKKTPTKSATKRSRAALRQLNTTPPPPSHPSSAQEKERLLESLQLSPLKVPSRLPEPTFSLNCPRMSLYTCEWSGSFSEGNLEELDRSYVMTVSVESQEGEETDINLCWGPSDSWDNQGGSTEDFGAGTEYSDDDEPLAKRARQDDSSLGPEDDELMTYALIGSIRRENSPSPTKEVTRHKGRSPSEGANPQDMLRKVGVDNLLSALHGKTKK